MRVFNLKSSSGSFEATEVLNPGRSEHTTPYPILQSQLYSADQPGTNEIWFCLRLQLNPAISNCKGKQKIVDWTANPRKVNLSSK